MFIFMKMYKCLVGCQTRPYPSYVSADLRQQDQNEMFFYAPASGEHGVKEIEDLLACIIPEQVVL